MAELPESGPSWSTAFGRSATVVTDSFAAVLALTVVVG